MPRNPTAVKHEQLNMGQKVNGIRVCEVCAPVKPRKSKHKKALGLQAQLTLEGIARAYAGEPGVEYLRARK